MLRLLLLRLLLFVLQLLLSLYVMLLCLLLLLLRLRLLQLLEQLVQMQVERWQLLLRLPLLFLPLLPPGLVLFLPLLRWGCEQRHRATELLGQLFLRMPSC